MADCYEKSRYRFSAIIFKYSKRDFSSIQELVGLLNSLKLIAKSELRTEIRKFDYSRTVNSPNTTLSLIFYLKSL